MRAQDVTRLITDEHALSELDLPELLA
jgi:hypothetical protein